MKILTKNELKMLCNIIAANQIIMNAYNGLDTRNQVQAFSKFCDNSANAMCILGGVKALNQCKYLIFDKTGVCHD